MACERMVFIYTEMTSIGSVQFKIWSAASILRSSLFEVTDSRCLYQGVEVPNGLRDPRFGSLRGTCVHCKKTHHECSGHWAHIRLALPVLHIGLVTSTVHWLRSVCAACGAHSQDGTIADRARAAPRVCPCGQRRSRYMWDKRSAGIHRDGELYSTSNILRHLSGTEGADLVLTVLPVPPIQIRPSLKIGSRTRGENDLTYRLQNIVRKNVHLREAMEKELPKHVCQERFDALQMAVTGYFDHEKVGSVRRSSSRREYTSLTGRIKGKEGTMRGHCMGKRVNQSGRCVVTGDNRLRLSEIGIPTSIARILTKSVRVTDHNLPLLREHPGVRYVVRPNGSRIDCAIRKPQLEVGWVVERSLQNGDVVLFNRQPSLHKMSIMAHTVRVLPYDTLRFNVACTTPYNADFDGDEMNIHVPQTLEAQAEAEEIMAVKYQVVSPQASRPVISVIQDSMLGAYLLSGDTLSRADAFQVTQQPIDPPYTGRRIFSQILPPNVHYTGNVVIEDSVMLSGRFRKRDLGSSSGSLIHVLFNDCGPQATVDFIYELEQITRRYLNIRGFTVGMNDLMRSKTLTRLCLEERRAAFLDVAEMDSELEVNQRLNRSRDVMGSAAMSELTESNQFYNMVYSGSKGSKVNITQIQGAIGQQNVRGKRVTNDWTDRTMTCFRWGDTTPQSKGFVEHTYLEGLSAEEMYFCAMAGREGLIDTAIKTAQTGYVERRLMKCLENVTARSDGSARDGDTVLSFQYGDDGLDAMRIERQRMTATHVSPDTQLLWSAVKDPALSGTPYFNLPIPVHRILQRLHIPIVPNPMDVSRLAFTRAFPPLVGAFVRAHTPEMSDSDLVRYKEAVLTEWQRCQIVKGESVGAIAAQSIGERTTQCTLNTFHFAGMSSKNVTLGLPRLEEILNLTKKIKTPLVTFSAEPSSPALCERLKFVRLSDLVLERGAVQMGDSEALELFWLFPDPGQYVGEPQRFVLQWHNPLALQLQAKALGLDIAYTEGDQMLVHVYGSVDVFLSITFGVEGAEWCKVVDDVVETSLDMWQAIEHIPAHLCWTLYSNDVHAMCKMFGIEAARSCILREVRRILAHYGIDLNVRHLLLLVDWMTQKGELTPMTRHGLKKIETGQPLKQATFEEVVGVFLRAAVAEREDPVESVSACILTGKPAAMGSNLVTVLPDPSMVPEAPESSDSDEDLFDDWTATAMPYWMVPKSPPAMPTMPAMPYMPVSPTYAPA